MQFKWIILFYLIIILFLYIKRKNVTVQAKVIVLYRTLLGIRFIERFSEKYREWVKLFGFAGIGIGFIGMVVIAFFLLASFLQLFLRPEQPPGVALVLPGVEIPGVGILPFWHWLIAIFIIAVVHEFSHGIVAHAHGLKVNFTGLVLLGPIIGAFVEPDEKKLMNSPDVVQYSVYAAGAWSNVILAVVAALCLSFVFAPLQQTLVEPMGFTFGKYYDGEFPARESGLLPGVVITKVNNISVRSYTDFAREFQHVRPSERVSIVAGDKSVTLTAAEHPEQKGQAFIGIAAIKNEFTLKNSSNAWLNSILLTLTEFLRWLFLLSFGIGLFNLLPLPIVDGGRMIHTFLKRLYGEEKGNRRYGKIGMFFFVLLVLSLVIPLFL